MSRSYSKRNIRSAKKIRGYSTMVKVNKLKVLRGTYYKTCKACEESKNQDQYYKNKNVHDGLHTYCKSCFIEHKVERQRLFKWELMQEDGGECRKCKRLATRDTQTEFHFHHVDPDTKVAEVSTLMRTANKQAVRDEAKKCILLCKTCHQEEHLA